MSRKRIFAIAAAVLAVIALFCLWYTRPVSAEQVMGGMPVDNFSGILNESYLKDGIGGFDTWLLKDGLDGGTPEYRETMDILGRATYRAHLRNLLGSWYSDRNPYEWNGSTYTLLVFTDGQSRSITFSLDQKTLIAERSWESRAYLYTICDQQTLSDIAALFHKYGTFQNE